MMKLFVVLSIVAAVAVCAPQEYAQQQEVSVVEYVNNENDGSGNYNYKFALSDGTSRDETGTLKEIQGEDGTVSQAVVMTGSYQFVDDKGVTHKVTYTADENGFHPKVEN